MGNEKDVAPYMGAWIEIVSVVPSPIGFIVAPYMGAWIEIAPVLLSTTNI